MSCWENRKLWGVVFNSKFENRSSLVGGGWHEKMNASRYAGEPSRAVLFTSRKLAREFCKAKNERYYEIGLNANKWKLSPVRVMESVIIIKKRRIK